jgi:hypothetical protein
VRHPIAGECGQQVLDGQLDHPRARRLARAADVRSEYDIRQLEKRTRRIERLAGEHVEAGGAEQARAERIGQRVFVHDAASCCVHEHGTGFHAASASPRAAARLGLSATWMLTKSAAASSASRT